MTSFRSSNLGRSIDQRILICQGRGSLLQSICRGVRPGLLTGARAQRILSEYSMSIHSTCGCRREPWDAGRQHTVRPAAHGTTAASGGSSRADLKTALGLFAAQGFDATSTKIAREVGIAEGLIFHYFPTKASLLSAILEDRMEERRAFGASCARCWKARAASPPPRCCTRWLPAVRHPAQGRGDRSRSVHGGSDEPRSVASMAKADPGRHRATTPPTSPPASMPGSSGRTCRWRLRGRCSSRR